MKKKASNPASNTIVDKVSSSIKAAVSEWAPNPFAKTCDKISSVKAGPKINVIGEIPDGENTICFALISLREYPDNAWKRDDTILNRKDERKRGIDIEACKRQRLDCSPQMVRGRLAFYEWALKKAIDEGARIICINELGFPVSQGRPHVSAIKVARDLANKHKAFILAGSLHDGITKYNTGYLFYPGCPRDGYLFHKHVSACQAGEYISIPPHRQSLTTTVLGFKISVIICLELMDYSTISSIVQLGAGVDFLLIPAYCEEESTGSMIKMARFASNAMPGGVALVNYSFSRLYLFDKLKKPYKTLPVPNNGGKVRLYKIDYDKFNRDKRNKQNNRPPDISWLFNLLIEV